ncbi:hypothetical protein [Marinobacterium aestuariivivens]|uniref:Uncharacterized protein n=1 Tax=Marinobacterium aestuariivivens TaxID=1698799 RepID=A0ABW2A6I5_9GAMM
MIIELSVTGAKTSVAPILDWSKSSSGLDMPLEDDRTLNRGLGHPDSRLLRSFTRGGVSGFSYPVIISLIRLKTVSTMVAI